MSSITGLISSGGGGGGETHIKTDPRQLTRSAAYRFNFKQTTNNRVESNTTTFWDRIGNITRISLNATASSNTYVNVLNITSAPNGGYVNWIISPSVDATNPSTTIRITVDGGDPYEFTYVYQSANIGYARMFMGGGIFNGDTPVSSTSYAGTVDIFNNKNSSGIASAADTATSSVLTYDDNTNKVYGTSFANVGIISDFQILNTMPFEKLRFESSILIEAKQQVFMTTDMGNYSGCFYTLH